MFNLLPEKLRSINSDHVDTFKNHLDVFLALSVIVKGLVIRRVILDESVENQMGAYAKIE